MDRKATPLFYIAFTSLQEVKFHKDRNLYFLYTERLISGVLKTFLLRGFSK